MYPEIFEKGSTQLEHGILLTEARQVLVKKKLNTASSLSFQMIRSGKQWKHINIESIVKVDGQLYVIKIINDGADSGKPYGKVECTHIWWELCEKKHVPSAFFVGESAAEIIGSVFSEISYQSYTVNALSSSEIAALGMTQLTKATDIDIDKTNPLGVLSKVISNVGGELYVDNFNFALVKELGRETNQRLYFAKNVKGIDRTVDTTQMVTRLYPYGESSLELDSINGGLDYIDSPNIGKYSYIHNGFKDYRDAKDANQLLQQAQWEFSAENYNRIDKPKVVYRCSLLDLWKCGYANREDMLDIGDYSTVYDELLDMDSRVRVVALDYYPYEPSKSTITLGDPPKTVGDVLAELSGIRDYFQKKQPDPEIISETIIQEIVTTPEFVTTITEVTIQEVVAADVIHATSAFIEDLFVERLHTNIMAYKCFPNLEYDAESKAYKWAGGQKTYRCANNDELRAYIEIEEMHFHFIEDRLVMGDPNSLTPDQVEPLVVNGKQVYYTSIEGGQYPYQFFTFADPISKYPQMTSENAEMFYVYIRKTEKGYVKGALDFDLELSDGNPTYVPFISLGFGDENGNGVGYIRKKQEGLNVLYSSRTKDGLMLGFQLRDDDTYCYDVVDKIWKPLADFGRYILEAVNFYDNGFTAQYGNGLLRFRWALDGDGVITQLTNVDSGKVIPFNWNGGELPDVDEESDTPEVVDDGQS